MLPLQSSGAGGPEVRLKPGIGSAGEAPPKVLRRAADYSPLEIGAYPWLTKASLPNLCARYARKVALSTCLADLRRATWPEGSTG